MIHGKIKITERPDNDARREEHRARFFQEFAQPVAHIAKRRAHGRHTVLGQFKNKRRFVAPEGPFFEYQRTHTGAGYAERINQNHGDPAHIREERRDKHGIDGHFRAARHERYDRRADFLFAPRVQSARAHQRGHGAAEAHEQRDERLAAETEQTQRIIRDKRAARHISAVLEQTQKEEQQSYLRQKRAHRAETREDSPADEIFYPFGSSERTEQAHQDIGKSAVYKRIRQLAESRAERAEGEIKHNQYRRQKQRHGSKAV